MTGEVKQYLLAGEASNETWEIVTKIVTALGLEVLPNEVRADPQIKDGMDSGEFAGPKEAQEVQPIEPAKESLSRPTETILGQLSLVLAEADRLKLQAQELVDEARAKKITWAQIANVTGVTPQSAYQRWSEKGRQKHREYSRVRRASK